MLPPATPERGRPDLLGTLGVGLVAWLAYLRTLYPGLVGIGDTPKFQYVGAILGTPHNPGYPLYVALTHVFSWLPWGTPAWRANLFSAVCAALAVALLYRLGSQLGCGRAAAACAALGAAFGPVFWSQATLAEVYALAAALVLAVVSTLVAWAAPLAPRPERRPALLLAAIAWCALASGHHLTIVMSVPAFVLYALLSDARAALRPRVLWGGTLLVLAGLAQYLFVLVRTHQGAPYLGSSAHTLRELLDVMRGAQFAERLFVFDAGSLLTQRLPALAALVRAELGWAGVLLGCVGAGVLARHRWREALLLLLGAAGVVGFALNYRVDDGEVFLIPAFVLLWPLVAVGAQALLAAAAPRLPLGWPRRAIALLLLALPAAQFARHFDASDHSARSFEARYFEALFEALPTRAVVLAETYTVDQMVLYELFGAGHGARKHLRLVPRDAETIEVYARRGQTVVAFGRAQEELEQQGFRFRALTPVDGPLHAWLERLPAGTHALLAGAHAELPGLARMWARLGLAPEPGPFALHLSGGPPARLVSRGEGPRFALAFDGPNAAPQVEAGPEGAHIRVQGRTLASTIDGVALALVQPNGRVNAAWELSPPALEVPFTRRAFPAFVLTGLPDCAQVGNLGWQDVSPQGATGRVLAVLDNHAPFEARLALEARASQALALGLVQARGPGRPVLDRADTSAPPANADARTRIASRGAWRANDAGASARLVFDLGGLPERLWVRAQVDLDNPRRARLCRLSVGEPDEPAPRPGMRIALAQATAWLGPGWSEPRRDALSEYRALVGTEAELLLPAAPGMPARVSMEARALAATETLTLLVDGRPAGTHAARPGFVRYVFDAPDAGRNGEVVRLHVRGQNAGAWQVRSVWLLDR
jgi:hypothetical protein